MNLFSTVSIRRISYIGTRRVPTGTATGIVVAAVLAVALAGAAVAAGVAQAEAPTVTGRAMLDLDSPAVLARGERHWSGVPVAHRAPFVAFADPAELGRALAGEHTRAFEGYAISIYVAMPPASRAAFRAAYYA